MLRRMLTLTACLTVFCAACDGPPDAPTTPRGKVDFPLASQADDACIDDDDCAKGETCAPGYCPIWCPADDPDCCVPSDCVPEEVDTPCTHDDDCANGETCAPGYCPLWCPADDPDCCVPAACVAN